MAHPSRFAHTRALVRDRASQFTGDFDAVFHTEGLKILKTPVRAPMANASAERWIATVRRELLDRIIIWNQRQLQRLVIDYIDHYNTHRPHRWLDQRPPAPTQPPNTNAQPLRIIRATRCGGLINEYQKAARPTTTGFRAPTRCWHRCRSTPTTEFWAPTGAPNDRH